MALGLPCDCCGKGLQGVPVEIYAGKRTRVLCHPCIQKHGWVWRPCRKQDTKEENKP